MPRYAVTRVYVLDARDAEEARATLDAARAVGCWTDIELEFESVLRRHEPEQPKHGWREELRAQLLGPGKVTQQPGLRKSQS